MRKRVGFLVGLGLVALFLSLPLRAEVSQDVAAGMPVVFLGGTHYERGFQHGEALHAKILDIVDAYILPQTSGFLFRTLLSVAGYVLKVEPWMEQEARGIVDGATHAIGGPFRSEQLNKTLTWRDLLVMSAYVDYAAIGCTSISLWGSRTKDQEAGPVGYIGRNLDWDLTPSLLRNQVILVHWPDEKDEMPFFSVGFAGLIGCLSCVNIWGSAGFIHTGPHGTGGAFPPREAFIPVTMALRAALERRVEEGKNPLEELSRRITQAPRMGSFLVHLFVPGSRDAPEDYEPGVVLELQPGRAYVRHTADAPELGGEAMVATNHHRNLEAPPSCRRYSGAKKALTDGKEIDPSRMRTVLHEVRRVDTMQSMVYVPHKGRLWLKSAWPCVMPNKFKTKASKPCVDWREGDLDLGKWFSVP